jgi:hypothetical protein
MSSGFLVTIDCGTSALDEWLEALFSISRTVAILIGTNPTFDHNKRYKEWL